MQIPDCMCIWGKEAGYRTKSEKVFIVLQFRLPFCRVYAREDVLSRPIRHDLLLNDQSMYAKHFASNLSSLTVMSLKQKCTEKNSNRNHGT